MGNNSWEDLTGVCFIFTFYTLTCSGSNLVFLCLICLELKVSGTSISTWVNVTLLVFSRERYSASASLHQAACLSSSCSCPPDSGIVESVTWWLSLLKSIKMPGLRLCVIYLFIVVVGRPLVAMETVKRILMLLFLALVTLTLGYPLLTNDVEVLDLS